MPLEITGVVKNANHIDSGFAAPTVDEEMPGFPDDAQVALGPAAAEEQVIRAEVSRQVSPYFGSGAFRIGCNITKGLLDQIPVANGGKLAESFLTPYQRFTDVSLGCGSQDDSQWFRGFRHTCVCE